MPLKLAFNPITAKLDLVQNLSAYAKLAISITSSDFFTAITNSTLIAGQWYLLTDYQNETPISNVDGATIYNTGAIEQIYLFATSTNEFHPEGISKTYPDEKVIIEKDVNPETLELFGYDYCSTTTVDFALEGGVSIGTIPITLDAYNQLGLSMTPSQEDALNNHPEALYNEFYDNTSGVSGEMANYNFTDDWSVSGGTLTALDGSNQWLTNGLDFTTFATDTDSYMYGYFADTFTWTSDYTEIYMTITSSTEIVINGTNRDYFTNRTDNTYLNIFDPKNDIYITLDSSNYGIDWTYNPATYTITYLGGLLDLLDVQESNYGYIETYLDYYAKTFPYGRIVGRKNERLNVNIQADYRSQLFRRYKILNVGTWSSSAIAGQTYLYNGSVWFCINTTTDTPSSGSGNWIQLNATNDYVMPNTNIVVQPSTPNYTIYYDSATYTDLPMFNTAELDALILPINLIMKAYAGQETANVTIKSIGAVTNSEISTDSSVIATGNFNNNKITMSYCVFSNPYDCIGNTIDNLFQVFSAGQFRYSDIKYMAGCLLDNFSYNKVFGVMQYCLTKTTFTENEITTLNYVKFNGYTNGNKIIVLRYTDFNYYTTSTSTPSCSRNYFMNFGYPSYYRANFNNFQGYCNNNRWMGFNIYANTFINVSSSEFYFTTSFNRAISINPRSGGGLILSSRFYNYFQFNVGHLAFASVNVVKDCNSNKFFTRCLDKYYYTISAGGTGYTLNDIITIVPGHTTTAWATSTNYIEGQYVTNGGNTYYCTWGHTSGTFSTDLTNCLWMQVMPATVKATGVSGGVVTAVTLMDGGSFNLIGVLNSTGGTGSGFKLNVTNYQSQTSIGTSTFYGTCNSNNFYYSSIQNNTCFSDFSVNTFYNTEYFNTWSNNIVFTFKNSLMSGCNFSQNTISSLSEYVTAGMNSQINDNNILSTMRYVTLADSISLSQNTCYALGGNAGLGLTVNANITGSFIGDTLGGGITISSAITNQFYLKNNPILLGGQGGKTISMERHLTSNTAGNSLTFTAGGATVGATDKNGGPLLLSSGTATGSGSSFIQFSTATAGASGTSDRTPTVKMIVLGNGNVGIGTTSPGVKLHLSSSGSGSVAEGIRLENNNGASGTGTAIDFYTTAQRARIFSDTDGVSGGALAFSTRSAGGVLTEAVRIDKAGSVGIGTTAPDKALEINHATGQNLRLTYNDSDGSAANYADFTTSSSGDLTIVASGGDISLDNENLTTTGTIQAGGYNSSDSSAGITQSVIFKDFDEVTHTLTFKDGLLTAYSNDS